MTQQRTIVQTGTDDSPFSLQGLDGHWFITWYDAYTDAWRRIDTGVQCESDQPSLEGLAAYDQHIAQVSPSQPLSGISICEVFERYLAGDFKTAVALEYAGRQVRTWARFLAGWGETESLDVSTADDKRLLAMVEDFVGHRCVTVSERAIRANLSTLRGALRKAHDDGLIPEMPNIVDPVSNRLLKKCDYLSYSEVGHLLDAMARKLVRRPVLVFTMITLSTCGHQNTIISLTKQQSCDGFIEFERNSLRTKRLYNPAIIICPTLEPWLQGDSPKIISRNERPIFGIWRALDNCLVEIGRLRDGSHDHPGLRRQRGLGSPSILRRTIEAHLNAYGLSKPLIKSAMGVKPSTGSTNNYVHISTKDSMVLLDAIEAFWRELDKHTDVHRRPDLYHASSA